MGLHVVDREQGGLPRDRKAFGGVEARGKGGAHAGPARHRDEIGFALREGAAANGDGRHERRGIFRNIREGEEAFGDEGTKTALVRVEGREGVDPAILAVVRGYFFVEVESRRGLILDAIVLFENGYRCVITAIC